MTGPEAPVLSLRQLNRTTLARQLLLARASLLVEQAVERLVATVKSGNSAEFSAIMNRGRAYLDVRAAARAI